jgi:hypothetical protein
MWGGAIRSNPAWSGLQTLETTDQKRQGWKRIHKIVGKEIFHQMAPEASGRVLEVQDYSSLPRARFTLSLWRSCLCVWRRSREVSTYYPNGRKNCSHTSTSHFLQGCGRSGSAPSLLQGGNLSGPLALPASFSGIIAVHLLFSQDITIMSSKPAGRASDPLSLPPCSVVEAKTLDS